MALLAPFIPPVPPL